MKPETSSPTGASNLRVTISFIVNCFGKAKMSLRDLASVKTWFYAGISQSQNACRVEAAPEF
jgi:hypothetical protein